MDQKVVETASVLNAPVSAPVAKRGRGRPLGSKTDHNRTVTRMAMVMDDGSLKLLGRGRPPKDIRIVPVAVKAIQARRVARAVPKTRDPMDINMKSLEEILANHLEKVVQALGTFHSPTETHHGHDHKGFHVRKAVSKN